MNNSLPYNALIINVMHNIKYTKNKINNDIFFGIVDLSLSILLFLDFYVWICKLFVCIKLFMFYNFYIIKIYISIYIYKFNY
jgi:hypothetical protein